MSETLFDLLLANKIPSWPVWQDENYLAFLTPFPNTPGVTVVIPKVNPGGNLFNLNDEQISGLVLAASKVARILQKAFKVERVGLVVEGNAVDHVHIKLYPMHGNISKLTKGSRSKVEFHPEYAGYLSSVEGPMMSEEDLKRLQDKIVKAAKA